MLILFDILALVFYRGFAVRMNSTSTFNAYPDTNMGFCTYFGEIFKFWDVMGIITYTGKVDSKSLDL